MKLDVGVVAILVRPWGPGSNGVPIKLARLLDPNVKNELPRWESECIQCCGWNAALSLSLSVFLGRLRSPDCEISSRIQFVGWCNRRTVWLTVGVPSYPLCQFSKFGNILTRWFFYRLCDFVLQSLTREISNFKNLLFEERSITFCVNSGIKI